jgi:hypothetical protein
MCRSMGLRLWLAVATGACFSGCQQVPLPPPPPDTASIQRAFGVPQAKDPQPDKAAGAPRTFHVYLDGSESMRGFVALSGSNYGKVVDSLLGSAATSGYRIELDRFGSGIERIASVSSATLLDSGFYGGKETSFPELLRHVARERKPGTIAVIVSDLVQSGSSGDQHALIEAFQAITQPEIVVLAFRSAFCGKYWVESRRVAKRTLDLCLNGQGIEQSRPFYAVLIADSRADLEEARRYLTADVEGYQEFDATRPGVPLEAVEPAMPAPGDVVIWSPWEKAKEISRAAPPRQLLSFFEAFPQSQESADLKLTLLFPEDGKSDHTYRIRSLLELRVHAVTLSYGADGKPASAASLPRPVNLTWKAAFVASEEKPQRVRGIAVTYSLPQPKPSTWDAYRIELQPGQANLRPPLWVEEWSTIDDSDLRMGSRTLKLDLFIKAMIRSIQENVPLSEHYLLLGRGER